MLTLFENITDELSDTERDKYVPKLLQLLGQTSDKNRYTGKRIVEWFGANGLSFTEVRLRKLMNYIRVLNLSAPNVVIGAGNGYYLTSDPEVIEDQIESLQGRINSMKSVIESLKVQKFTNQHKKI